MEVRFEELSDKGAIHYVHEASFSTAGEAKLVDQLRDSGKLLISLVARVEGEIVGHVAFSPVTLEGIEAFSGLGLGPVAVLEAHRRQGIAGRLIRRGLEIASEKGAGCVVVLGDPNYYGRFGFKAAEIFGLIDDFGGGRAFQALEFSRGAIPGQGGRIHYAEEFAAVGG